MKTIEYFIKDLNINVFKKTSQVKANSFIDIFDVDHRPSNNDSYLVIGKNIVGYGLKQLGYLITEADGLEYSDNDHVSLLDLISQEKTYDYIIAPDEYFVNFGTEEDQIKEIYKLSHLANKGLYTINFLCL